MIEIIITIAATAGTYRLALAATSAAPAGSRWATIRRWLGVDERRSGGAGEERATALRRSGGAGEER